MCTRLWIFIKFVTRKRYGAHILKYFVKPLLLQDLQMYLTQEIFVRNSGLQEGDNMLLDLVVPFSKSVTLQAVLCK